MAHDRSRAYELRSEAIRLDSTSLSTFRGGKIGELFKVGYRKDYRPHLGQLKIMSEPWIRWAVRR